jgi:glutathione synthase/RimK-type ligase-like ATP-grasp enzyme
VTVLLWGVPSEGPVALVGEALARIGVDAITFHPRAARSSAVALGLQADPSLGHDCLTGWLQVPGRRVALAGIRGVYVRPIEPELLPEHAHPAHAPADRAHARRLHDTLIAFTEVAGSVTGCRVANRLSSMASNISKPYQAQSILRHGFSTPATLVTNDPDQVLDFVDRHGSVVYKSISGVRSIVTAFDASKDRVRLQHLRWCPVQFQEQIDGPDVRVHVVGDEVFAAKVDSEAIDYRYARAQVGHDARLTPYQLPDAVADACVALATDLDLPFSGVDLKMAEDGRVVCFEVNPSPGFSWYEQEAGLPISAAVASWLAGG